MTCRFVTLSAKRPPCAVALRYQLCAQLWVLKQWATYALVVTASGSLSDDVYFYFWTVLVGGLSDDPVLNKGCFELGTAIAGVSRDAVAAPFRLCL